MTNNNSQRDASTGNTQDRDQNQKGQQGGSQSTSQGNSQNQPQNSADKDKAGSFSNRLYVQGGAADHHGLGAEGGHATEG